MAKHGGKRAGAGRKTGAAAAKTRAIADKAAEAGQTPLEYMLDIMRSPMPPEVAAVLADLKEGEALTQETLKALSAFAGWHEMRFEAAKAAAPFVHPRLQAVEHKSPDGGPVKTHLLVEFVAATK